MTKVNPEDTPAAAAPAHVTGLALYGRMLLTGCSKCILPMVFILLSKPVADSMAGAEGTQEAFEQIAGGLLVYTFAYGCWAEIDEQFEHAAGRVGVRKYYVYAGVLLLTMMLAPLFYVLFELDAGETVFSHGITGSAEGVCPEHPAASALNLSKPLCSCTQGRKGTAAVPTCTSDVFGFVDLVPYLIGFALDGMVLVLLEGCESQGPNTQCPHPPLGDEALFSCAEVRDPSQRIAIIFTVFLKPIMFALDNVLTGTAMATVVNGVAASTGMGVWLIYFLNCSMTIIGVLVAMTWHAFTALFPPFATVLLRLAFMTLAALSFLDNGLEMCKHGLTFWVGLGFLVGWTLKLLGQLVDEVWEPYFTTRFAVAPYASNKERTKPPAGSPR